MTDHSTPRPRRSGRLARFAAALLPWALLTFCTLVGGLAGVAYSQLRPPAYTATSYVVAVPTEQSDPATALGFAQAYGRAATQLAVLGDAQVKADVPVRTLQRSVRTATSPDAPMIAVSATSRRPGAAARMANAVAGALTVHANATKDSTRIQLLQFSRAVRPTEPSSPSPKVTLLVGTSAGGLLGGLILLVRPRRTRTWEHDTVRPAPVPVPAPAAADVHGQL
ncbi:YveK family protein [Streptomyces cellulosae]|uniref:LPS biosynthesis protein n=1 Tax=Streptomyces cellulosae TaxID=1968 RepID=UPI0004C85E0B|nr:LPS biosynthesis protein [Streptomyces cellulosae]